MVEGTDSTAKKGRDGPPYDALKPLLVAVCTYNERDNLPELVTRIFAAVPTADLLVVDDNSPDQTGQWAIEASRGDPRIRVLSRTERGLGGAIRAALQYAVERGYEYLVNLDGDLSHAPEAIPDLVRLIASDPGLDVAVGSRYCPGGRIEGWPRRRRWMSRLVNRFAVKKLNLPISDCSGSLRCYRVATLARIRPDTLESDGYSILEEILVRIDRSGGKMAEIPIIFTDRTRGQSKLSMAEAYRSAKHLVRLGKRYQNPGNDNGKASNE